MQKSSDQHKPGTALVLHVNQVGNILVKPEWCVDVTWSEWPFDDRDLRATRFFDGSYRSDITCSLFLAEADTHIDYHLVPAPEISQHKLKVVHHQPMDLSP